MVLEVKNVSYAYKSQKGKEILKNVSMQFEEKKFYTIVGASGAGKTTFLSLLAGLDMPVKGTVLYDGEDIQAKGLNYHRKHHVSLVFQNYNLISLIMIISSACAARYLLCVTTMTHFPSSCAVLFSNSIISPAVVSSRLPVGSSASNTFALLANALTMATRCC